LAAFEKALFPKSGLEFVTSADVELVFDEMRYAYNQPYKGRTEFGKHLFRVVGDLAMSGEEFDCAVYIDRIDDVKAWVRNTVRQPHSFWLQTSSDRFYPDFIVLLKDGRILVIEYKGAHLASAEDAQQKKLIGDLWAERSEVSISNDRWPSIWTDRWCDTSVKLIWKGQMVSDGHRKLGA
jgi:type III restriction enzyme